MVVAIFKDSMNQQIHSTCQNFNQFVLQINSLEDLNEYTNGEVIFCVDHQCIDELKAEDVKEIDTFEHSTTDVYVFGPNFSLMTQRIKAFKHPYRLLTIRSGKTLWTESALAIVLYDKWIKEVR